MKPSPNLFRDTPHRRSAFTLAEMLVVLVILAVLAFVAVESLRPVVSQARYDATRETLENVRRAIVGDPNVADSAGVRGFIADVGRPPVGPQELVDPSGLPTFGLHSGPSPFADIKIPAGWRGPYVIAPPGTPDSQALVDGWGRPFHFVLYDPAQPLRPMQFVSLGSSRSGLGEGYNSDLSVSIDRSEWHPSSITGKIYFRYVGEEPPTGWQVAVLFPNPDAVGTGLAVDIRLIDTLGGPIPTNQSVESDLYECSYFVDGETLTCGPRAVVAVHGGTPVGQPVFVHLKAGATHIVDLNVGDVPPVP